MSAKAIPILMYHHVTPAPGLVTVSPQTFDQQMQVLSRNGYRAIGCDQLLAFVEGRDALPDKSVLITFDDGYLDNYVYAHPILARYGLKASVFVVTSWIGQGAPRAHAPSHDVPPCPDHRTCKERIAAGQADDVVLRWSEVEAMRAAGTFEFHSHTHTHTRWDRVDPDNRLARMEEELTRSRAVLAERLGETSPHLCWPQGYYEPAYQQLAKRVGFSALYTTEKQVVTAGGDPLALGRMVVKDRADSWFDRRLWLYRSPRIGKWYLALRGR